MKTKNSVRRTILTVLSALLLLNGCGTGESAEPSAPVAPAPTE